MNKARALVLSLAAGALALAAGACIQRGYPLSSSGTVDIRLDVAGPLFAADRLGEDGTPVLPRQSPSSTGVTLSLAEDGEPAYGGYVDVRVSPPEAFTLASDPAEEAPTCASKGGAFRCTATREGFARFVIASESTWSGTATLQVNWGGNAPKEQAVTVLPAGLPQDATDFRLIVGGLGDADRVLATYVPLSCTLGPVPDDLGSKWRPGAIRARQAYVTASPPPGSPTAVADAPVVIESRSAEGALSLTEDCADRSPRLRVLLNASGQTDPFYLCFSDNGGTVAFAVTSGAKQIDPEPEVKVDPEPRVIRVRALSTKVAIGYAPVDLFEISAYNADRVRISMPVDVSVDDPAVLGLDVASVTLAGESDTATVVQAMPLAEGEATLHVLPRLLDKPDCASPPVTVVAAETSP